MSRPSGRQARLCAARPPPSNIRGRYTNLCHTSPTLVNAGSFAGPGFEIGASAQIIDGLTLSGSFSWNQLEADQPFIDTSNAVVYPKGGRLAISPEYTVAAAADYEFPLGGKFDGRVSVSANYVPEQIAQAGTFASIAEAALTARASFALNAQDRWSASLFVENLTDEKAIIYDPFASLTTVNNGGILVPTPVWDIYQRPRTIGLQLEYRY